MSALTQDPQLACTLLIGSAALVDAWSARSGSTTVIPVVHTDVARAIDALVTAYPEVVIIEQSVAGTESGSTLMARLHDERYERGLEVRLLSRDGVARLMADDAGEEHPQAWLTGLANALPSRPRRGAERVRVSADEQAFIDGQVVTLIDISAGGAQVRSSAALRPQQRVRLVLPRPRGGLKAAGVVAWSAFEMAPAPRYRAGIAFTSSIPNLADDFRQI